jgi:hypothetical protein
MINIYGTIKNVGGIMSTFNETMNIVGGTISNLKP